MYVIVKLHALLGRKCIMVSSHSYSPDTKNTHYTCLLVCVAFYRNADVTNSHITIIGLLLAISAILLGNWLIESASSASRRTLLYPVHCSLPRYAERLNHGCRLIFDTIIAFIMKGFWIKSNYLWN